MKQTKLRRRRVIRYAILYFVLFVVILALIVGPAVAGKYIPKSLYDISLLKDNQLFQPTGLDNDDTRGQTETGKKDPSYSGVLYSAMKSSANAAKATGKAATTTTRGSDRLMMLI
jgi:1,3-beta-glucan synthase